MPDLPILTLLIGPQTSLSLGINALIRDHRNTFVSAGLNALQSRLASPILRRAVDGRSGDERREEFWAALEQRPAFLSAVNFFGPPHAGLMKREMFPEAETLLTQLADIAPHARIVLSIDTLPAFFLASGSEPLEARVKATPWETLYELSWSELAQEIKAALPKSELIVLAPSSAGTSSMTRMLLGKTMDALPDPHWVLRNQLSETGQAVLDRLVAEGQANDTTLAELHNSFATPPSQQRVTERLGLDKVTQALLEQRFAEDLGDLHAMPGTEVLT